MTVYIRAFVPFCVAAIVACGAGSASGTTVTVDLASGPHSGRAQFEFSNGASPQLTVTLMNTMTANAEPNWFTAAFFNISGSPTLDYVSTTAGMVTVAGDGTRTAYTAHDAGQFWAYRDDLPSSHSHVSAQQYGLSSVGAGLFGSGDMLESGGPGPQPGGVDGGILGDFAGLTVSGGHQSTPFVLGSIEFTFGLPAGFDVNNVQVSDVAFLFGSGFDEKFLVIPLPAPAGLALAGMMLIAASRRRKLA